MRIEDRIEQIALSLERVRRLQVEANREMIRHLTPTQRVVVNYKISVGGDTTSLLRMTNEQVVEYATRCREYLAFGRRVDDVLLELIPKRHAVEVCNGKDVVLPEVFGGRAFYVAQRHIHLITEKKGRVGTHGVSREQFKRLPEMLSAPALVAKSPSRADSVVIVPGEVDADGCPIIIAVRTAGEVKTDGNVQKVNFVTSMYGKSRSYLKSLVKEERLLYFDAKKSSEPALAPLRLRGDHLVPARKDSVTQKGESVNYREQKKLDVKI